MLTVIQLNVFWTLAVSASLFFVVYGISLFLQREEFVVEIWNLILSKVKKIGV
ncbi:TPA: hypothetical protein U1344_001525 [Streptococcus suis]|nr:hypothetical protein [Streptococcus suis]